MRPLKKRERKGDAVTDKQRHQANRALIAAACVLAAIAGAAALKEPSASASQVFVTPRGQADNVQFTQLAGGVVQITYDLISDDPRAVFSVTLDASDDGGQTWTLKPKSITGDVGPNVSAGRGKRILWEAGRDVETPRFDQFRFRLNPVAGRALPPPATNARTGRLSIRSTPDAATVVIDGQTRGLTPLSVTDLAAGEHVLAIQKAGYLENRSTVTVRADASDTVTVSLTPMAAPTKPVENVAGSGGGGKMKWYLLGGAGAAIAGAVAASSKSDGGGGGTTTIQT